MKMSFCPYCQIQKPISDFSINTYQKSGHRKKCKSCTILFKKLKHQYCQLSKYDKEILFYNLYFILPIEDREFANLLTCDIEFIRQLRFKFNIKRCCHCFKVKSLSDFNTCSINCSRDGYFSYCIDCYLTYHQRYRQNYEKMEIRKIHIKQYYLKHRQYIFKRINDYCTKRRNTNKYYKFKILFSNTFRRLLHCTLSGKSSKNILFIESCLGYTFKQLIVHLESQFTDKMNWDNYGKYWHIDHIIPQSMFSIERIGDEQFCKCWSLSNLRPLLAIDNLKKGNSLL